MLLLLNLSYVARKLIRPHKPHGLCATLFNMGHIHLQSEEPNEAMQAWVTVYQLASKMNLAQVLDALENLAPQLGMEGGLQGWKNLAEQSTSATEE